MISQFKLGRNEADRALRAELKQAAPHVFAKPAPAPRAAAKAAGAPSRRGRPPKRRRPSRRRRSSRWTPLAPRAKAASGGGEDWNEF